MSDIRTRQFHNKVLGYHPLMNYTGNFCFVSRMEEFAPEGSAKKGKWQGKEQVPIWLLSLCLSSVIRGVKN